MAPKIISVQNHYQFQGCESYDKVHMIKNMKILDMIRDSVLKSKSNGLDFTRRMIFEVFGQRGASNMVISQGWSSLKYSGICSDPASKSFFVGSGLSES